MRRRRDETLQDSPLELFLRMPEVPKKKERACMTTPIFHHGHQVGELREDRVFITKRTSSHIFHKYNGLGISESVLWQLKRMNCRKIIFLLTRASGDVEKIETTPGRFELMGQYWMDKGEDKQLILGFEQMGNRQLEETHG